jgi:hypothetical protein
MNNFDKFVKSPISPARSCLAVAGLSAYTAQAGGHQGRGIFSTYYETIDFEAKR